VSLSKEVRVLLLLTGFCSLSAGPTVTGQQVLLEDTPEFRTDNSKEAFKKAVELFNSKEYGKAQGVFNKLRTKVARRADREKLEMWMRACTGGGVILKCERIASSGGTRAAFFQALDGRNQYVATPAKRQFDDLIASLSPKVVYPLEDFEYPSGRYTEKYGKHYVRDDAYHGDGCLRWAQTRDKRGFQLKAGSVPKDWSKYNGVVFWLKAKNPAELQVIVLSPGTSEHEKKEQQNSFMAKVTPKRSAKWNRFYMRLGDFKKFGQPDFQNVSGLLLQTPRGKNFEFVIDYICLTLASAK
jgi:hypothetical protein